MIGLSNLSTRNHWIASELFKLKGRILDAGAGELQWKTHCSHLEYVSQDLAEYDGDGDGKGLQCKNWKGLEVDIKCDITRIPDSSQSFDAILCSEVLDHVPDPVAAVQELDRLLKPGGTMLLTESFCGLTNQSPYFYYTGLSINWYKYHLKDYTLEITYNGSYYEWIAQEIHRMISQGDVLASFGHVLINQLERAMENKPNSHEILCFGLLVKAVKNV
jgi:ubiquinone/menaquinone biosynthesis C-methylase UbiE